jgi:lipopolysaccharide/colanic/teichoic acid biosynthesis glycosyltransferase
MHSYFQYVHNLKGTANFEKLDPTDKNVIISLYIKELLNHNELEYAIERNSDTKVLTYIAENLDLRTYYPSIILTTDKTSYLDEVNFNNVRAIINLKKVNNIQHPNKLFRAVNTLLPDGGIYIGRLETYAERKTLIYSQLGRYLGRFFWMADFLIHRVIPRMPYLENLYYYLTNGEFHAISHAEILGRLIYCGFDIIDFRSINGLTYFVVIKTGDPLTHENPSYYPVIKLNRVGQHGKMIKVYKLRTMHPYSEYLQDFLIKMHGYNKKGKPANDFRVTRWGKIFRSLWLDEFPQLWNVLKGEMKLVGLRPLSRVRFNEFPEDLKKERVKFKPGCFPPYVALNMPDSNANIEAERIYIRDLTAHPYTTDIRYFLKSVYNIVTNRIRSS